MLFPMGSAGENWREREFAQCACQRGLGLGHRRTAWYGVAPPRLPEAAGHRLDPLERLISAPLRYASGRSPVSGSRFSPSHHTTLGHAGQFAATAMVHEGQVSTPAAVVEPQKSTTFWDMHPEPPRAEMTAGGRVVGGPFCKPTDYIGGATPSLPTITRLVASLPSAFLVADRKTGAPTLRSARSAGAKVTIGACGGTTTLLLPPL